MRNLAYPWIDSLGSRPPRPNGSSVADAWEAIVPAPDFSVLGGWVAERTLAEKATTQIVLVHHQEDRDRRPFVAKIFRPLRGADPSKDSERLRTRLLREVVALRALDGAGCPDIAQVVTFGMEGRGECRHWYVMPFYQCGPMWSDDGRSGPSPARYRGDIDRVMRIAQGVAATLAFMHEGRRCCVHGDISGGNLLFAEPHGSPILADFGNAQLAGHAVRRDTRAAAYPRKWRAPELDHARAELTPATDMFMLGGLIYEALSGGEQLPRSDRWVGAPFDRPSEYSLYRHTSDGRAPAVEALIIRLLAPNPRLRLSASQVVRACKAIRTACR